MTYEHDPLLQSGRKTFMGHNAILVDWPGQAIHDLHPGIHLLAHQLKQVFGHLIIDIIPSLNSLCLLCRYRHDQQSIYNLLEDLKCEEIELPPPRLHEVPVSYFPQTHEDVCAILRATGLCYEEILLAHQSGIYQVLSLGFLPGFAYMGFTDKRLHIKRKATPSLRVRPGTVAIADSFTAIYPSESPGGWHLIGETPYKLFDKTSGAVFRAGDRVKFISKTLP